VTTNQQSGSNWEQAGRWAWDQWGDDAVNWAGSQLGGGGKTCPGQPSNDAVAYMLSRLTPAERSELDRLWRAVNKSALPTDPGKIAHAMMGGNDCQMTWAGGKEMAAYFFALLARYPMPAGWKPAGWSTSTPAPRGEPVFQTTGAVSVGGGGGQLPAWLLPAGIVALALILKR
jgi:hypothetical protein